MLRGRKRSFPFSWAGNGLRRCPFSFIIFVCHTFDSRPRQRLVSFYGIAFFSKLYRDHFVPGAL